jgi:hypothetical protein
MKGKRLRVFVMGALLPLMTPSLAHARVYVSIAPPAPVVEVRAGAPSSRHVWVPGYYRWHRNNRRYVWNRGYWAVPPRHRSYWVPGHWAQSRRGWYWSGGRWR